MQAWWDKPILKAASQDRISPTAAASTSSTATVDRPPAYDEKEHSEDDRNIAPEEPPSYDDNACLWITPTTWLRRGKVLQIAEKQCFAASAGRRAFCDRLPLARVDKWRSVGGALELRCDIKSAPSTVNDQLRITVIGYVCLQFSTLIRPLRGEVATSRHGSTILPSAPNQGRISWHTPSARHSPAAKLSQVSEPSPTLLGNG